MNFKLQFIIYSIPIVDSMSRSKNNIYNIYNLIEFATERKGTVTFGLETLSYRSAEWRSFLLVQMRQIYSLDLFNGSLSQWACNFCPYRLYKVTCKMLRNKMLYVK